jgi:hypothetical protein
VCTVEDEIHNGGKRGHASSSFFDSLKSAVGFADKQRLEKTAILEAFKVVKECVETEICKF